jgi:hypothetical protein
LIPPPATWDLYATFGGPGIPVTLAIPEARARTFTILRALGAELS